MPTSSFPWRPFLLFLLPFILQWNFSRPEGGPPHLSEHSLVPLLYAAVTAVCFHRLAIWLFRQDRNEHGPALAARIVAGIVAGVPMVFLLQWSALNGARDIMGFGEGNPAVTFFLTVLGWGYSLVDNSMVGFGPALLGYIASVGLVEESSKAAVGLYDFSGDVRDRAACGFVAGAGFGIGEALLYCFRDYNGDAEWPKYVTRFVFCVGLHGCMSATAALLLADTPVLARRWKVMFYQMLLILPVAFLHGLYDVLLERQFPHYAVLVAFLICACPAIALWVYERRSEEGLVD